MSSREAIEAAIEQRDGTRVQQIVVDLHPADAAAAFVALDAREQLIFAEYLDNEQLTRITSHLPSPESADLVAGLDREDRGEVLEGLPDDIVADLIQESDEDVQQDYVNLLPAEKKDAAETLLAFPEESAGGRMTTAMATVREDMSIREAIASLEELREDAEILARIYVTDDLGRILGKVRLRDLTFTSRSSLVQDIMDHEQIAIHTHADQEEAVGLMLKYDMLALPVVNDDGKLMGIITHDDALEIQEEESTEDIERAAAIAGAHDEEGYLKSPVIAHLRRRSLWILFLALVAILSGLVIFSYEKLLDNVFLLAVYMPMVVATGGNTGAQSATMVIRAMSLGEFTPADFARVVWKELRIGLILGALLGLIIAAGSYVILGGVLLPSGVISIPEGLTLGGVVATVGISLTVQVACSTLLGAALPMLAKACRLDPAVVASPAITTVVDVLGLLIYFGLATLILGL